MHHCSHIEHGQFERTLRTNKCINRDLDAIRRLTQENKNGTYSSDTTSSMADCRPRRMQGNRVKNGGKTQKLKMFCTVEVCFCLREEPKHSCEVQSRSWLNAWSWQNSGKLFSVKAKWTTFSKLVGPPLFKIWP